MSHKLSDSSALFLASAEQSARSFGSEATEILAPVNPGERPPRAGTEPSTHNAPAVTERRTIPIASKARAAVNPRLHWCVSRRLGNVSLMALDPG